MRELQFGKNRMNYLKYMENNINSLNYKVKYIIDRLHNVGK